MFDKVGLIQSISGELLVFMRKWVFIYCTKCFIFFLFEMDMSTHQFLEFCLCVEAPAISSSVCFTAATETFWLVAAI